MRVSVAGTGGRHYDLHLLKRQTVKPATSLMPYEPRPQGAVYKVPTLTHLSSVRPGGASFSLQRRLQPAFGGLN
jgi:hypothetical protein